MEEELNYRVNIDEDDLQVKLDRIRNQIDTALGSSAMASSELPSFATGAGVAGGGGGGGMGGAFGGFGEAQDQSFWGGVANFVDSTAERSQMGFSRFTDDLRRIGLLSQPSYPTPDIVPMATGIEPTRAERTADFITENTFGTLGAVAGLPMGLGGGLAVGAVGMGLDAGLDLMAGRQYQRDDMGEALQSIAQNSFGHISGSDARGMADMMQDSVFGSQRFGFDRALDMDQVQSNVMAFSQAGGFDSTTGQRDMQETLRGVVEETRKFAEELGIAQEEAAGIMAQLEQKMIASTTEMGGLANRLSTAGEAFGLTGGDMMGIGVQGADMVRGSGITARQGFDMATASRRQIGRMMRTGDDVTKQILSDFATPEQAAIAQMESSNRFMLSGMGMIHTGGVMGGVSSPGASTADMLGGFASHLADDPGNLFAMGIRSPQVAGEMSFEEMQLRQVNQAMNFADDLGISGPEGEIDSDVLAGIMMSMGITSNRQDSMLAVQSVMDGYDMERSGDLWNAHRESALREQGITHFNFGVGELARDAFGFDAVGEVASGVNRTLHRGFQGLGDIIGRRTRHRAAQGPNQRVSEMMLDTSNLEDINNLDVSDEDMAYWVGESFLQDRRESDGLYSAIPGNRRARVDLGGGYREEFHSLGLGLSDGGRQDLLQDIFAAQSRGLNASEFSENYKAVQNLRSEGDTLTAPGAGDAWSTLIGSDVSLSGMENLSQAMDEAATGFGLSSYEEADRAQRQAINMYIRESDAGSDLARQAGQFSNTATRTRSAAQDIQRQVLSDRAEIIFNQQRGVIDGTSSDVFDNLREREDLQVVSSPIPGLASQIESDVTRQVSDAISSGKFSSFEEFRQNAAKVIDTAGMTSGQIQMYVESLAAELPANTFTELNEAHKMQGQADNILSIQNMLAKLPSSEHLTAEEQASRAEAMFRRAHRGVGFTQGTQTMTADDVQEARRQIAESGVDDRHVDELISWAHASGDRILSSDMMSELRAEGKDEDAMRLLDGMLGNDPQSRTANLLQQVSTGNSLRVEIIDPRSSTSSSRMKQGNFSDGPG